MKRRNGTQTAIGEPIRETPSTITCNAALERSLEVYQKAAFVAIDTEFMRERTYYPQLCLIQISDGQMAVAIDPLAPSLDLAPLWELLKNPNITKVFHAGGQDIEIFLHRMGCLPEPIYDTQLAAMVCGLGDQVGYDKLVKAFLDHDIDKTSRFTDWSKRPLSSHQIDYALNDVIYLAKLYPLMQKRLEKENRGHWLDEEYAKLLDLATYVTKPEEAWRRLKVSNMRPKPLLRLIHLAAWREREAQKRDLPRGRILRDETLMDLAASNPRSSDDFAKIRNFPGGASGKMLAPVMQVLKLAAALPEPTLPELQGKPVRKRPPAAVLELLRVLLKHVTDEHRIAPRLVATADEIELLAIDDNADIRALSGWRRDVFGEMALRLKNGELAVAIKQHKIIFIEHKP